MHRALLKLFSTDTERFLVVSLQSNFKPKSTFFFSRFFTLHPSPKSKTNLRKINISKNGGVDLYLQRAKLIDTLRLLLRSNPTHSLLLETIPPTIDTFVATQLIRSSPSPEAALSFFQFLKTQNPDFTHNQNTCHALAKLLSNTGRHRELHTLIESIKSGEYPNVSASYMDLLRWHAGTGDLDAAVGVWSEIKTYLDNNFSSKKPCSESYNILLGLYADRGRDSEAVQLFSLMINNGALPNSRTYTVLIKHLVRAGRLEEGLEIFRKLPSMRIKRTLKQYSVLVETFAVSKRVDAVKFLIREMQRDGIMPGHALLASLKFLQEEGELVNETKELVNDLLPDGRIGYLQNHRAREQFEFDDISSEEDSSDGEGLGEDEIRLKPWLDPTALANALRDWDPEDVRALESAKLVWTTRLVSKMLRAFKRSEAAWAFFCWVAHQPGGFTHDVYTVSRMIVILARNGNVELVNQLVSKVKREGIQLSFSTVRLVVDCYGISKNADAALKIFREFSPDLSKFNNGLLYSSLIRTLVKCRKASEAMDLLEEMMLSGIHPDIQTYSGLMQHFALEGDLKMVQQLFGMVRQSGIEPDAYAFKILIHAYCKKERAVLAMRVLEDMLTANLMPDAATKSLLVKSLWKEGKLREAAAVEERIGNDENALPVALPGQAWTVSNSDLMWIYDIYAKSFAEKDE